MSEKQQPGKYGKAPSRMPSGIGKNATYVNDWVNQRSRPECLTTRSCLWSHFRNGD